MNQSLSVKKMCGAQIQEKTHASTLLVTRASTLFSKTMVSCNSSKIRYQDFLKTKNWAIRQFGNNWNSRWWRESATLGILNVKKLNHWKVRHFLKLSTRLDTIFMVYKTRKILLCKIISTAFRLPVSTMMIIILENSIYTWIIILPRSTWGTSCFFSCVYLVTLYLCSYTFASLPT